MSAAVSRPGAVGAAVNRAHLLAGVARKATGYDIEHPPGLPQDECDVLDALWWMSWQPVGQFGTGEIAALERLAARGLVDLAAVGAAAPNRVRLAIRRAGDQTGGT